MPPLSKLIRIRPALKKNGAQSFGPSRSGNTTKIHAVVDALGNPYRLALSPGQAHDVTMAPQMLAGITHAYVLADKAYDADALVQSLEARDCEVIIPSRKNRVVPRHLDKHTYKERHLGRTGIFLLLAPGIGSRFVHRREMPGHRKSGSTKPAFGGFRPIRRYRRG